MKPEGQSLYGDHAYVFFQVPTEVKGLPLVFLHGAGQSGKTCAARLALKRTQRKNSYIFR